ncbi:MAG: class I SAM-dependent methyltransferase [Balneolaceae bacterium]|nr:MAG: class I SAM-dependent methyltransferase [Balneolaceae bacterium]
MQEFWNKRYSDKNYAYGIDPNVFFKEQLGKLKAGKLLLPGEGEGRNAVYAAKRGWEVTAVDFSVKAQIKANNLAAEHDLTINYIISNLMQAEIPEEEFDAAAFIYVHLTNEDAEKVLLNVIAALKPGGTFFMECYSEKQLGRKSGGPKDINRLYTIPQMRKLLSGLKITKLNEVEVPLQEGEFHQGKAMVIRAVGVKP